MGIQPEIKVKKHGGNQSSDWLSFYCPSRPFILLIIHRDQWVIQNSVVLAASFCISFCIQKVSGDLHYLLAKRLVNTFWLSFLMNVNFISPKVFFFNLHLLKALKLPLYRTKVQWVVTKKVLNSKI